jgi:hypothetical protein
LGATHKTHSEIRVRVGDVSGSAIAVGKDANASVLDNSAELSREFVLELTQLMDSLINQIGRSADEEVVSDAQAVRAELNRKRVNLGLIRPALKGIAASLGAFQSAADIATNVLNLIRHLG